MATKISTKIAGARVSDELFDELEAFRCDLQRQTTNPVDMSTAVRLCITRTLTAHREAKAMAEAANSREAISTRAA